MHHWAANSTYYHIVIDRFATDRNCFKSPKDIPCDHNLTQWMGGTIQGISSSLDYLQQLGIGAILLTPFFKGKRYHGYWTTDFEKIDPHFGNPKQLTHFIENAHQRNIRVIMDLPITHCHSDTLYAKQALANKNSPYREWFYFNEEEFLGFFGDSALPELNLELPELRKYLKEVTDRWLNLGFDGIRFDHAKRPSASFWENFTDHLRQQHSSVFLLGENWHESGKIGTLSPYLHSELNIPLSKALRQFTRQPCLHTVKQVMHHVRTQKPQRQQGYLLPTFLDSHDLERVSYLAEGNHDILALSYLLQLTLPYPPIIYYGSERGQTQSNNLKKGQYERDRFFREPMDWQQGKEIAKWVSTVIHYRNKYSEWFMSEPLSMQIIADCTLTYSYSKKGTTITVFINISPINQKIVSPDTPKEMLTSNANIILQGYDTNLILQLPGYSGAIVCSKQNHATPDIPIEETTLTVA